jgi:transposase IS66-like protein
MSETRHYDPGSDGGADRWATVCSLITTAKLNDVEPFAYLEDVLERMSCPGTGAQQPPSTDTTCQEWRLTT